MNVLVAVASKHGGTTGIAQAIADELRGMGFDADLRDIDAGPDPARYDAVVIGSAVYIGRWLDEAREFVAVNTGSLRERPVWLFSSGPLGAEDPKPAGDPAGLAETMAATNARGHAIFSGRLEPTGLNFGERLVAKAVHAPSGDFRAWPEIRTWAREIGEALHAAPKLAGAGR